MCILEYSLGTVELPVCKVLLRGMPETAIIPHLVTMHRTCGRGKGDTVPGTIDELLKPSRSARLRIIYISVNTNFDVDWLVFCGYFRVKNCK